MERLKALGIGYWMGGTLFEVACLQHPSVSDDPCLTLRELSEFGTRDEPFLRRLAIEATSFLDQDKNIERVREVIVDLVLKIEIETILGGPAGELRARLHKILDVIVAKRGY